MSNARELAELGSSYGTGGFVGMKNRIINGGMNISQRGTTAFTSTGGNFYTLDRWQVLGFGAVGKFTVQQTPSATETGYATRVGAGFNNYLAVTSTSAYTLGATDIQSISQSIEGFNVADLAWGTANAKTVTISFWVYSSLTGTFGGTVLNGAYNYSYPFTYTIPTANTWTQITLTIAGPTAGTWVGATNGNGVVLNFSFGTGSTYKGTAGAWTATGYYGATGETNVTGTNGATFYITGVQLEKGSTATSFDYRPYTTELQLCQRYCAVWNANLIGMMGQAISTTQAILPLNYPVTPRTSATGITSTGTFSVYGASAGGIGVTALAYNNASDNQIQLVITVASGLVAGNATGLINGTKVIATGMEL